MRGVYCIFQNVVKIGKIFGFGAHSPAPIGGGKCSDVVLGFGSWSLVVLNDKISVLGIVFGLEGQVLGPGLGLESRVLDPLLFLEVFVFALALKLVSML